ncbi:MAG: hypothetical protein IKI57_05395 [Clostridia bacterium]|nr:hypothetical protein [Clostridia bacterium]
MRREGIRTHYCLGIEPKELIVTHSNLPVKMEKGFSFSIPADCKKKLKETFRKACNLYKKEDEKD